MVAGFFFSRHINVCTFCIEHEHAYTVRFVENPGNENSSARRRKLCLPCPIRLPVRRFSTRFDAKSRGRRTQSGESCEFPYAPCPKLSASSVHARQNHESQQTNEKKSPWRGTFPDVAGLDMAVRAKPFCSVRFLVLTRFRTSNVCFGNDARHGRRIVERSG